MPDPQPRRLEDFEPLTPAEQQVLDELDTGEPIIVGTDVPDADAGNSLVIRARFLRWVLLGCEGSENHRVHEKGVQIEGALITGEGDERVLHAALDLEGAPVHCDIVLEACRFTAKPNLLSARMQGVYLTRSHFPGARADRLQTRGKLAMDGVVSTGEIRLLGAEIVGDLSCVGATMLNVGGTALLADSAQITGYVLLRKSTIEGEANFLGARVGRNLECDGATLRNHNGTALDADGARVSGGFFWRNDACASGVIDLVAANIGVISDDPACWPGNGKLVLNRCLYGAFTGKGITAKERLRWLALQDEARGNQEFWPQPYEQCAKVLREMGHQDEARTILVEKERRLRQARRKRASHCMSGTMAVRDWFLSWSVCYGQKPLRAAWYLLALWLLGTVVFLGTYQAGAFKPNNAFVLRADEWVGCAQSAPPGKYLARVRESQLECFLRQPQGQGFPAFDAAIYSLDVVFPLVQLEQQVHWIPDEDQWAGWFAKVLVYVQIVMGWLLSLLAVAGLSGIIKSD